MKKMIDLSSLNLKWKKQGKAVALSILIFLSLSSIHYVTFVFSIDADFRALLDIMFKTEFAVDFFILTTFSIIVARYLPQGILALGVLFISEKINLQYYRRGYRRVATIWGIWEHRHSTKESRKAYKKELLRFGRKDARLENLIIRSVQKALPLVFYEKHKILITVYIAIFIGLQIYLGFTLACWLLFLAVIISKALDAYLFYSDCFKFNLKKSFTGDDPNYEPKTFTPSSHELFVAAMTMAVIVAVAGPLRLQYITQNSRIIVLSEERRIETALVGATTNDLIIFDGEYTFIPFSKITEVRSFPDT